MTMAAMFGGLAAATLTLIPGWFVARPLLRAGRRHAAIASFVSFAAAAIILYMMFGEPRLLAGLSPPAVERSSIDAMVERLAERLQSDPNDLAGWRLLGRSYVVLGRYEEAAEAYGRVLHLTGPDDAQALADYAEALVLADPSALQGQAAPFFERVRALDPTNVKGLWYGGLIAYERREYAAAIAAWQALLERQPPEEFRAVLERRIEAARQAAGMEGQDSE